MTASIDQLTCIQSWAEHIIKTLDSEDFSAKKFPGLKEGLLCDAGERAVWILNAARALAVAQTAPTAQAAPAADLQPNFAQLRKALADRRFRGETDLQDLVNMAANLITEDGDVISGQRRIIDKLKAAPAAGAVAGPVKWWNGCDKSVPAALRFLADHERPAGGESSFNSAHLYQLADEIERMARTPMYTEPAPEAQAAPAAGAVAGNPMATAPTTGLILLTVEDSSGERRVFAAEASHEESGLRWMITTGWDGWKRLHSAWTPVSWLPLSVAGAATPTPAAQADSQPAPVVGRLSPSREWLETRLAIADDCDVQAGLPAKKVRPCDTPPGCNSHNCMECNDFIKPAPVREADRAARATADSVLEDAARLDAALLDFIEQHPEMNLRHRKGKWAFVGFTNYEYEMLPSLRDAIRAARKQGGTQ